uniref:Uncharacterized protein n=1 Tax=Rhizophora mucronata TaxID=61149 RepID=A0A2P2JY65_RHIMU
MSVPVDDQTKVYVQIYIHCFSSESGFCYSFIAALKRPQMGNSVPKEKA